MTTHLLSKAHSIQRHFNWQQWGMYGLFFFFLKGMLWLIMPFLLYQFQ